MLHFVTSYSWYHLNEDVQKDINLKIKSLINGLEVLRELEYKVYNYVLFTKIEKNAI